MNPDTAALRNISAITKIYCATASEYRLRNHRAILGSSISPPATNRNIFSRNRHQNPTPAPLPNEPTMAASTTSASVRAIIEAPTHSVTLT
ncbi:unknown [Prevotella sp. CAG:592]|nr:unknown [Prevotella sp. CAG:592]